MCLYVPFHTLVVLGNATIRVAEILGFPKGGIATLGNSDFHCCLYKRDGAVTSLPCDWLKILRGKLSKDKRNWVPGIQSCQAMGVSGRWLVIGRRLRWDAWGLWRSPEQVIIGSYLTTHLYRIVTNLIVSKRNYIWPTCPLKWAGWVFKRLAKLVAVKDSSHKSCGPRGRLKVYFQSRQCFHKHK